MELLLVLEDLCHVAYVPNILFIFSCYGEVMHVPHPIALGTRLDVVKLYYYFTSYKLYPLYIGNSNQIDIVCIHEPL